MSLQIEVTPFQFNNIVTGLSSAIFNSVSAVSLSGIHYGNGSNLTDVSTSAGTIYSQNSASYTTSNFVNSNFFNLTGGTILGATRINSNLTIFGNLSATGNSYFANTVYSTTSALSVINIGNTGPALFVGNNGTGDIASFYDLDQNIEVLHVGGINGTFPNVGVKTSVPNVDFTVNGQISANNTIWSANGNSVNWNTAYQSVSSNPFTFISATSSVQPIVGSNIINATGVGGASVRQVEILGGCNNSITTTTAGAVPDQNPIGTYNTSNITNSTILGGCNNAICGCSRTDILGGVVVSVKNSSILGGCNNKICGTGSGAYSNYNANSIINNGVIISGCNNKITQDIQGQIGGSDTTYSNTYSVIVGGCNNSICNPSGVTTSNIFILGSNIAASQSNFTYVNNISSQGLVNATGGCSNQWNTSYQTISTIPYILNQTLSSVNTLFGSNTASGIFSEVLGGVCNTASGIYSTIVNAFSSCTTAPFTFVGSGSGNRVTGNYGAVIGGVRNTASGIYSSVVGGNCNTASGCYSIAAGGYTTRAIGIFSTIGGGRGSVACGGYTFVGGGCSNVAGCGQSYAAVGGGVANIAAQYATFIGGGSTNVACSVNGSIVGGTCNCLCTNSNYGFIGGGHTNRVNGLYSSIVGGKFNFNPLFNSDIHGGAFNHTGGYALNNITAAASISGNGTNTALIATGIGSCFSTSGTTGAVSLVWMTPGTANNTLSSALFTTANVVTNAANCIIINGDYSTCTASGLSACNIYVYDRCVNNGGCNNFIGGGILNTASACYSIVGGGFCNNARGCWDVINGGRCNNISGATNYWNTIGGGSNNTISGVYNNTIAGGFGHNANGPSATVSGGSGNTACGNGATVGGGLANTACAAFSTIGGGCQNLITPSTACSSTIAGGRGNFNPLTHSVIGGGLLNHMGGYTPSNVTTTSISGNGTQTALIQTGIGSCFSGVNSPITLLYMTSGTNISSLSSACYINQSITTNAANCIVFSNDYSTCTAAGLSACSIYVFDRCLNQTGCFNFIGGGTLNTNSGNYSSVVGGKCNTVSGSYGSIGGGCGNCTVGGSTIAGGLNNKACGGCSTIGGGNGNCIPSGGAYAASGGGILNCVGAFAGVVAGGASNYNCANYSGILGGCANLVTSTGTYSSVVGGRCNTASGAYSFVAGGSANDTKGFANTFILGTGLSANRINYTYVNNLSSQGTVVSNPLAVANSQAATIGVGAISNKFQIFDANGNSLGYVPIYASIT